MLSSQISVSERIKCQSILASSDVNDIHKLLEVADVYLPYIEGTQLYYALLGFKDYCKTHPELLK